MTLPKLLVFAAVLVWLGGCSAGDQADTASGRDGSSDAAELDASKPAWLRMASSADAEARPGSLSAADGSTEPFVEVGSWKALKQIKAKLLEDHARRYAVGRDWFAHESHGYTGLPLVVLRILPYLEPDIFGQPDERFIRFGFLPATDPRRPLPFGLGWKAVQVCDPAIAKQARNSPDCVGLDGSPLPAAAAQALPRINKVTVTCGACHVGQVEVDGAAGRYATEFGAPNALLDIRSWRHAFERLAARYEDLTLNPGSARAEQRLRRLQARMVAAIEAVRADGGFYGGYDNPSSAALTEERELQFYLRDVTLPTGRTVKAAAIIFQQTLEAVRQRKAVFDIVRNVAYVDDASGRSPDFDASYLGGTDAAGEAIALVSVVAGADGRRGLEAARREITPAPAIVDFMSVFNQGHRPHPNWDGSIGSSTARSVTTQLGSTGSVDQLDFETMDRVNEYIEALPPPPYPFALDEAKARAGRQVFDRHCVDCHRPNNEVKYPQIATVTNRIREFNPFTWQATVNAVLLACDSTPRPVPCRELTDADSVMVPLPPASVPPGYPATPLHGAWISAPYLHNGSVPTLFELLVPSARRDSYVRGSIKYDQQRVGFHDAAEVGIDERLRRALAPELGQAALERRFRFDSSLRGMSNRGHDRDIRIGGYLYKLDWSDQAKDGRALPGSQLDALLEYLKTL